MVRELRKNVREALLTSEVAAINHELEVKAYKLKIQEEFKAIVENIRKVAGDGSVATHELWDDMVQLNEALKASVLVTQLLVLCSMKRIEEVRAMLKKKYTASMKDFATYLTAKDAAQVEEWDEQIKDDKKTYDSMDLDL